MLTCNLLKPRGSSDEEDPIVSVQLPQNTVHSRHHSQRDTKQSSDSRIKLFSSQKNATAEHGVKKRPSPAGNLKHKIEPGKQVNERGTTW